MVPDTLEIQWYKPLNRHGKLTTEPCLDASQTGSDGGVR
jgi:hypothetical protein